MITSTRTGANATAVVNAQTLPLCAVWQGPRKAPGILPTLGASLTRPHPPRGLPPARSHPLCVSTSATSRPASALTTRRSGATRLSKLRGASLYPVGRQWGTKYLESPTRRQGTPGSKGPFPTGAKVSTREPPTCVRTATEIEIACWWERSTLVAVWACSKGYGRIEHRTVGERASDTGLPNQVLHSVMEVYGGSRLVRVHGAVAHLVRGCRKLTTGCSFAEDILKDFLFRGPAPPPQTIPGRCGRDITLRVEAATLGEAAAALREDLDEIKGALRADNVRPKDAKSKFTDL